MNKLAYYQGYMKKQAGHGELITEAVGEAPWSIATGGLSPLLGILTGAVRGPEDPKKYLDEKPKITNLLPTMGSQRIFRRELSTLQDDKGGAIPGADAGFISELANTLVNPISLIGAPVGAAAAAVTGSRTPEEQREHDKSALKQVLMNTLVPGMATYNAFKRVGSTVVNPSKEKRSPILQERRAQKDKETTEAKAEKEKAEKEKSEKKAMERRTFTLSELSAASAVLGIPINKG